MAGGPPRADDEAVIDRASAEQAGFTVGDTATVLVQAGPQRIRIAGIARFGRADNPGGATVVLFTQAAAQRLMGAPGKLDGIAVVANPGVSQTQLRDRIASATPGVEVVTGKAVVAENQHGIRDALKLINRFLLLFAANALFVGSFVIYNTFSIVVAQRGREVALLRAIGASRRQVLGSVLLEAAGVGLIAALLGVAAGIGVAAGLKTLLVAVRVIDLPAGGIVLASHTVIVSLLAGVVVTVASAVLPARRAATVAPVAALRDLARDRSATSWRRVAAGATVTAGGAAALSLGLLSRLEGALVPVGLGILMVLVGIAVLGPVIARPASRLIGAPLPAVAGMTGTLARENAVRNPKRTAATAAALMIGVSLVAFITILTASAKASAQARIDRSFPADFVIDSGSGGIGFGGFSPDLATRLGQLPQVAAASGERSNLAEIDGTPADLAAVDPASYDRIVDLGVTEGRLADLGRDGIAVLDTVAKARGWSIGDRVPVRFAVTGPRQLTVAAIFHNHGDLGASYVLGLPAYDANFTDRFDAKVLVKKAEGVSPAAARAAVERVTAAYPTAKVQDRDQAKRAQAAQINRLLGLVDVLLALAVVIALLGIANTLVLSVFERIRELGLLRAVGMTRRQVRSMVRWESVVITLFGTSLGLVIGLLFSWAVVATVADQGAAMNIPVAQVGGLLLIAALAAVLTAVPPAHRASNLDILTAIHAE